MNKNRSEISMVRSLLLGVLVVEVACFYIMRAQPVRELGAQGLDHPLVNKRQIQNILDAVFPILGI